MSFSRIYSAQVVFLKGELVTIEVDLSKGLHAFSIVGLPDKSVEESKDRISAAIKNSGFTSPKAKNQKVVISLAPAELKKEGATFDVAMALGYLLAAEEIKFNTEKKMFFGELSLDGGVRKISGILAVVKEAAMLGFKEIYVPKGNASEAALVEGVTIYPVESLRQVIDHLNQKYQDENLPPRKQISVQPKTEIQYNFPQYTIDISDIKGQETAKRGLEIAAAGGHNIALYGPPGTGKTMLAKAFCGLLPALTFEEIIETTCIHSVANTLQQEYLSHPPFRSPHHTSSYVSVIGGGTFPKPGEVTLAHKGVLFLDEFPEFDRRVLESLREPLEEGVVNISRSKGSARFPSRFILIAAMNPCPCGNYGNKHKPCTCAPSALHRYQQKVSGPLIDRIDLWIEVSQINYEHLSEEGTSEKSIDIRKRIADARIRQQDRFKKYSMTANVNSEMNSRDITKHIFLTPEIKKLLNASAEKLKLSARSYHRIIKIAQTIADLSGKETIEIEHMLEALQYRPKNKN